MFPYSKSQRSFAVVRRRPNLARIIVAAAFASLCFTCLTLGIAHAAGPLDDTPILRIDDSHNLPVKRKVSLGLNKAMIVELPVDNRDIIVSHPETLDASLHSARRVVLFGKGAGAANVFFLGKDGRKVLVLDVTVRRDLTELSQLLASVLPGSRVTATSSGTGVVLSGNVTRPADSARAGDMAKQFFKDGTVVNLISVSEREQVMLKVTVAEIHREAIRRLGVNVPELVAKAGTITFSQVLRPGFPVTSSLIPSAGFTGSGLVPAVGVGNAAQITANAAGVSVSAMLEALERAGLSRTLAQPSLTAISGETAKFLAGGEFPVPVASRDNTLNVIFKQFGVNVAFTPFVLNEGAINLKIAAEVSELSPEGSVNLQGLSIPGLKVRRAETSVEMPSGSALALAGLLSDQTRQNADGFPMLRRLPILGALFSSKEFLRNETELVILVTPYIVRATDPAKLARPDDGFAPSNDLRGLFLGSLNRIYRGNNSAALARADADVGFIVAYPEHGGLK